MSGPVAKGLYANAEHWRAGVHIGIVVSVQDPQGKGRVQVKLPALDIEGEAPIWARVAVPFAGDNFGAFFIPDVDTEVLVAFLAGDAGWPVVIGNLWNGKTELPESINSAVDRWTLTGKNGTRIAIVEESPGQEKVEITTPNAAKVKVSEAAGGEIKLEAAGNTVRLSTSGVKIQSSGLVQVNASVVTVSATQVSVDAPLSTFSGLLQCDVLLTNTVISSTYTPGAGNVW
jgi:uncharacterized protein involved in type VI secretion and phage assembly